MNTGELLEKYFDVAFAATDGIKKLRELILSLAMQGKLVPQDEADQPAKELLKNLIAEKNVKIKLEDMPFQIPNNWEWVRLGEIGETNIGLVS